MVDLKPETPQEMGLRGCIFPGELHTVYQSRR